MFTGQLAMTCPWSSAREIDCTATAWASVVMRHDQVNSTPHFFFTGPANTVPLTAPPARLKRFGDSATLHLRPHLRLAACGLVTAFLGNWTLTLGRVQPSSRDSTATLTRPWVRNASRTTCIIVHQGGTSSSSLPVFVGKPTISNALKNGILLVNFSKHHT